MAIIITNKHNLPEAIVNATKVDKHFTNGDISVTQLIDAPQVRLLRRRHDIYEDAMDRVWALMGTAIHHIIELGEAGNSDARKLLESVHILNEIGEEDTAKWILKLIEDKFPEAIDKDVLLEVNMTINVLGWQISGTIDRFRISSKKINDYKNCSVWTYVYPEAKKKWSAQQNIYSYILRENGYEVEEAAITAIFRDWSVGRMKQNKDYPPHPIMEIPLQLGTHEQIRGYIEDRVRLHQATEISGEAPECTAKERWSSSDTFKVRKEGAKRSVKNFDKLSLAKSYMTSKQHLHKDPLYIETVVGEDLRCSSYCPVREICPQRKRKLDALAEKSAI